MRTKLILTTAALGVASSLGATAQVYSVNAVGYINVTIPAGGLKIVANQLNTGGNTANEVLPNAPDGTFLYKYSVEDGYVPIQRIFGEWTPNETLAPGEAFFVAAPAGDTDLTLTFVGEVPQGQLEVELNEGLNLVSSPVPQAGGVTEDLGYPAEEGDFVYQWDVENQAYVPIQYIFGEWSPSEPQIAVGEGFFISRGEAGTWTRDFSVNP